MRDFYPQARPSTWLPPPRARADERLPEGERGAHPRRLTADLGKAPFEGYATELGLVYDEITICLKHLTKWTRPRRVASPIVHFHSTSKVYPSPLGVVLVLSPWNYPVQLALVPMVDAIAAGNCVALKPSRTSKATSELLIEMLAETCSRPSSYALSPVRAP